LQSTTLILCPSLVPLRWCVSSLFNFLSCAPAGYTSSFNFSLDTEYSMNYCFKFYENKMWELLGFTIGIQSLHILTPELWFHFSLPLEALCHTQVCADYLRTEKNICNLLIQQGNYVLHVLTASNISFFSCLLLNSENSKKKFSLLKN
jgi:hypothetical protein